MKVQIFVLMMASKPVCVCVCVCVVNLPLLQIIPKTNIFKHPAQEPTSKNTFFKVSPEILYMNTAANTDLMCEDVVE